MALKSIVKVSHLSNLSDARFCAGMGVDLLGFGAIPGASHYLPPVVFQEIRGWLAGPRITAELYGITSEDQIQEVLDTYAPDYFELTWNEYNAFRPHLSLPCIVHVPEQPGAVLTGLKDEQIIYVTTDGDTTCAELEGIGYPVLSRVASVEDLEKKMKAGCFAGFVLEGPRQVKTGVTSYDELGEILERLEE